MSLYRQKLTKSLGNELLEYPHEQPCLEFLDHRFWGYATHSQHSRVRVYRGNSLIRNNLPLGPYSRPMPWALRWSWGGGLFLMNEVPL